MTIHVKRIYEPAAKTDGYRILVDRLWPRGIKKEAAHIDTWLKEVAPSDALRKWFGHEPTKWESFRKKYQIEIKGSAALKELIDLIQKHKTVTLLYAAKDEEHNQALALKKLIGHHAH